MLTIARKRLAIRRNDPVIEEALAGPDVADGEKVLDLTADSAAVSSRHASAHPAVAGTHGTPPTVRTLPRATFSVIASRIRDHGGYQNSPSQQALETIAHTAYFRHR